MINAVLVDNSRGRHSDPAALCGRHFFINLPMSSANLKRLAASCAMLFETGAWQAAALPQHGWRLFGRICRNTG